MTMRTLYCEAGDHEWERPAQRGRTPINCPDHAAEAKAAPSGSSLTGLAKAHAARANRKSQEEKMWAERIEETINDPRMQISNPDPYKPDARRETINKLRYIQDQLANRKDRPQNELYDLEKIREKIMKDPFNRTGHLY